DALRALTVRLQALSKRAIHARTLRVPPHVYLNSPSQRDPRNESAMRFRPPIDSYELWRGNNDWHDRKDVLAYGAGADLIVRIKNRNVASVGTEWEPWHRKKDNAAWLIHGDPALVHSLDEIAGVHLLPQLDTSSAFEEIIYARRRGIVQRVILDPARGSEEIVKKVYDTGGDAVVEKTDIDRRRKRTLAVTLNRGPIQLFKVDHDDDVCHPFASIEPEAYRGQTRTLASKLLSDTSIAVWSHRNDKVITLFDIKESEVRETRSLPCEQGQKSVCVIAGINPMKTQVFLTGWQDGSVRLHDVRVPRKWIGHFDDSMRSSPVNCLQPMGSTHFLSGLGAEGVIQLYDLRQPKSAILASSSSRHGEARTPVRQLRKRNEGFTVFLSESNQHFTLQPYRGPIYSFSQPSSSSSTVWVGVDHGVARLDLVFSTDLSGPSSDWYSANCQIYPYKWGRKGPYPDLVHFNLRGYYNGRIRLSRVFEGPFSRTLANPPFQSQTGFIAGITQARIQRAIAAQSKKQGKSIKFKKYEWRWEDVMRGVRMSIDEPTAPRSDFEEEEIPWWDQLEEDMNETT
ncbi:hypothetical protein KEM54_006463, partial [Ascosphaera aggregata]